MADEETVSSSCKASCGSRSPPHPPLRGTFSPSKAGEKGKKGDAVAATFPFAPLSLRPKGRRRGSPHFPSPHEVGRRCPGGADEGLFLRDVRWQTRMLAPACKASCAFDLSGPNLALRHCKSHRLELLAGLGERCFEGCQRLAVA